MTQSDIRWQQIFFNYRQALAQFGAFILQKNLNILNHIQRVGIILYQKNNSIL